MTANTQAERPCPRLNRFHSSAITAAGAVIRNMSLATLCAPAPISTTPLASMTPRTALSWPPKGVKKQGAAVIVQAIAQIRISWSCSRRICAASAIRSVGWTLAHQATIASSLAR